MTFTIQIDESTELAKMLHHVAFELGETLPETLEKWVHAKSVDDSGKPPETVAYEIDGPTRAVEEIGETTGIIAVNGEGAYYG